jgi:hypothetical protein
MSVIWLNGTIGSGKSAVGAALAKLLPHARFLDGDDFAGHEHLPDLVRWRMAVNALLLEVRWGGRFGAIVVAYPLEVNEYRRLRADCARAHRALLVVILAPPLALTLRGRGGRVLGPWERARVREMWSEGYHHRPFASVTLRNTQAPAARTARRIIHLLRYST